MPGGGDGRKGGLGIQLDLDGAIQVGAGIDKDVVRKVVKDNNSKLQYCYEKTLLANRAWRSGAASGGERLVRLRS